MERPELLSIDEALSIDRKQVREYYKTYINPGLVNMMGLLDFDKQFVKADGVVVWDREGNRYLDFLGAYGALNLGHNPPKVIEAVQKVMEWPNLLQAALGTLVSALGHNLAQVLPGDLSRSFFCNSGAEAVEGALKLAKAASKKNKIVYCEGSFHGKSFGALSVTGREKYQRPFQPLLSGCEAVPFGDSFALEEKIRQQDVAAFILEPIQGEGGVIVPPQGYLKAVRELCTRYGVLLIFDEIQTGFGRTGAMFACEHEDVVPDIICLAKSLGGGVMPVGAYCTKPEIWDQAYGGMDKALLHTSTFGGNTWAAAAALAAINQIVEERLWEQARDKGDYMLKRLRELQQKYSMVKEVRGQGLLIGIEFEKPAGLIDKLTGGMINKLSEEYFGALVAGELQNKYRIITAYTLNNPNVIRLEPPLVVTKEQIDQVVDALEAIFKQYKGFMGIALAGGRTALGSIFKR
ncbi:MAG: aspartate aminotransferase family protein [Clostridia bacterium]|nr:aspartate aminotransferase family protein [Clostridia bacterium]